MPDPRLTITLTTHAAEGLRGEHERTIHRLQVRVGNLEAGKKQADEAWRWEQTKAEGLESQVVGLKAEIATLQRLGDEMWRLIKEYSSPRWSNTLHARATAALNAWPAAVPPARVIPTQTEAEAEVERLKETVAALRKANEDAADRAARQQQKLLGRETRIEEVLTLAETHAQRAEKFQAEVELKAKVNESLDQENTRLAASIADLRAKLDALVGAVDKVKELARESQWHTWSCVHNDSIANLRTAADAARQPTEAT